MVLTLPGPGPGFSLADAGPEAGLSSQLSALGSKTLPCVKNYIRVEKRGLVACWSSGEALAVLEK